MGRTVNADVSTTPLLKREDCKRTKHDSAFSQWKILIGPCDWNYYLLNKEGAERYRTHNLPNCASSPGLYELGVAVQLPQSEGKSSSKLSSKCIIPVYLGQADNVRTRLQQYGRDGAHLENGSSNGEPNDRKALRLFSDILSHGFAIAFRWAPMESKKDAEKTETQLLNTFNYAWNREMNGERRPSDIHRMLDMAPSSTKRAPPVFKKLHIFRPKKVGLSIKRCEPPMLENGSSFYTKQEGPNILPSIFKFSKIMLENGSSFYTKQDGPNILPSIFKFSRSRPTLVSKESDINNSDGSKCGVALGQGSICTKQPVEGRKRCADHKGMKVNAFARSRLLSNTEDNRHVSCGVTLDDASLCTRVPVVGNKRCEEHKGMRTNMHVPLPFIVQEKHYVDPVPGTRISIDGGYSSGTGDASLTCEAITLDGSFCRRKPGKDSKFCWQHEAARTKTNHSSCESDLYENSPYTRISINGGYRSSTGDSSLTCGAMTLDGSFCRRKTGKDSKFCWQHEATRTKTSHSYCESYMYESSRYSSTCGAITRRGTFCSRRTTGGQRCYQH